MLRKGRLSFQNSRKKIKYIDYSELNTGYWISPEISAGSSVLLNKRNVQVVNASVVNGYRFSEFLKVGIGVGVRYYIDNDKFRDSSIPWAFPVFANVRGNFMTNEYRKTVPYWSVDVGVAIRDGLIFAPTLGLRIGERRSAFLVGITYSYENPEKLNNDSSGTSFLLGKIAYEF
ncbi:MAG: hypothetical protein LIP01_08960 [Tannerellaceae bacterium]|nr:hypothetical protein [Tannerellaceae bacterium]